MLNSDAIRYKKDHPELTIRKAADKLGVSESALKAWMKATAIYTATSEYVAEMAELPQKHRVSVSGVLKILGVSRSGYRAWKQRVPSQSENHRNHIKEKIKEICDESYQNYGAPKITEMLHKQGECIAEKAVWNYMRQIGIKAQWIKPYTVTTIDSDFSSELQNILDEQFNPSKPDAVWVSDIIYIYGHTANLCI